MHPLKQLLVFVSLSAVFLFCDYSDFICDDCIHPSIRLYIRDARTSDCITDIQNFIITHNDKTDTVTTTKNSIVLFESDSSYAILRGIGSFTVRITHPLYETVLLEGIRVQEHKHCSYPMTQVYELSVNPRSSRVTMIHQFGFKIIKQFESGKCL